MLLVPTDVHLGASLLNEVRVVQLESRTLGANARQRGEVVGRRRAGGCPLQRVAVAPRIIDSDDLVSYTHLTLPTSDLV